MQTSDSKQGEKVAYLGPDGSYSSLAAEKLCPEMQKMRFCREMPKRLFCL